MANIPNFLDVNRKKIDFFSASNIIRTKGNIVAGPGPVLPDPSPTPTPTSTPIPTSTPTPTPTPYEYSVTGTGTTEQVSVLVAPGYENSRVLFNGSPINFEVYGLTIFFNDIPTSSVTYAINKEGTYFSYSPGIGSGTYVGRFVNATQARFP